MMRYRDLAVSVDWLCNAFGFGRDCVVCADDGSVIYAQLVLGGGMVMLGPVGESDFDKLMRQPAEIGGAETQSCYLVVEDINAHYVQAKAAGAEILIDLTDDDARGRGYSCRDPGGHIWNFGTYDPWGQRPAEHESGDQPAPSSLRRVARFSGGMLVGAGLLGLAVVGWSAYDPSRSGFYKLDAKDLTSAPLGPNTMGRHQVVWKSAEDAVRENATSDLEIEARLQESARKLRIQEEAAREMRTALTRERLAKHTARQAAGKARAQLAQEREARLRAERTAEELREQRARERQAARPQPDKEKEELAAVAPSAPQTREDPSIESPSQAPARLEPANAPTDKESKSTKTEPLDKKPTVAQPPAAKSIDDKQALLQPDSEQTSSAEAKKPIQEPTRKPVQKKKETRQKKRKTTAKAAPQKRRLRKVKPKPWPYSAWE